jgi:fructan beta-fructosidase
VSWINDPNGLVHHDGEYHLFFQHNPFGDDWGNISWGHAVSRDLVRWERLPVAIAAEGDEAIFSGSAVVDQRNTSGFGTDRDPPMVAIYTSAYPDGQAQSLAYSTDRGRTWTKYAGNPVLRDAEREFRDPKVFWHEPAGEWRMVVVKAAVRTASIYASADLKRWEHCSDFAPDGASEGVWECPDLFPLPLGGSVKWVLVVSVNPGAVAGGSGMKYFVGDFDGTRFRADGDPAWLDYGRDYYAAVSWNGVPDGRRIMIGWMGNWEYAHELPGALRRSAMSVPREIGLRAVGGRVELVQRPVLELRGLRTGRAYRLRPRIVRPGTWRVTGDGAWGGKLDVEAAFRLRGATRFGVHVLAGGDERTVVGYDAATQELYVDRTRSGDASFSPGFAGVQRAPLAARRGRVRLRILVDRSSVEVFAGHRVITDQVFPSASSRAVRLFAEGGPVGLGGLTIRRLRATWR